MAIRIKYLMTAALQMSMPPGEAMDWVAERVGPTGDMFATGLIAVVEPTTGTCTYANAGHPSLLVHQDGEVASFGPTGPLLGPYDGTWGSETIALGGDAVVVGYTDGVVEARAEDGEMFGVDRLAAVIAAHATEPTADVAQAAIDTVRGFAPGPASDDLTLAVMRIRIDPDRTVP